MSDDVTALMSLRLVHLRLAAALDEASACLDTLDTSLAVAGPGKTDLTMFAQWHRTVARGYEERLARYGVFPSEDLDV